MRQVAVVLVTTAFVSLAVVLVQPQRAVSRAQAANDFLHFESGQVHPLAITPDGTRLLAVNTPDGRLSVFSLTGPVPQRVAEIPVGLEPVSVAVRDNNEAWVVNHLSDDISIVNLQTMHVRATLRVGDEPSDVVFAGSPLRAWVSVSQEDAIKLYDPANPSAAPQVLAVPARKPRSLAVSSDRLTVYAAVLFGNDGATVLSQAEVGDSLPAPQPPKSPSLPAAPKTGLIVHHTNGRWRDGSGKFWDSKVPYTVPRVEVLRYSTATPTNPRLFGGLATSMFATSVNPVTGVCASVGTEARTEVRFEPNLRGHTTEGRVALIDPNGGSVGVALNPHINYSQPFGPAAERDSSLAVPTGATWSADGQRLYVTAMGSARMAVMSASGQVLARVATVSGPTGTVVDGARGRVYVLGRFRNQLQTFSEGTLQPISVASLGFDPTPDGIVNGRKFFYAGATSGHGDQSCASCHFYGDMDDLAWDLGDPTGTMTPVPPGMLDPALVPMHPMKGPMTTQSLRGLINTGVLHWRGDRNDFLSFNGATQALLGLPAMLPDSEMVAMQQFVLPLVYPPNPRQRLDRSFPDAPPGQPSAERGRVFYVSTPVDGGLTCSVCHALPTGTNGQITNRLALRETQDIKVPQLRNMYQKTGFTDAPGAVNKRGAGFTKDGSTDNLFNFLKFPGFNFAGGTSGDNQRRDLEAFMLAFDTGMAPAVGAQVTFDGSASDAARVARMDTLVTRANAGDCDLIARGRTNGKPHGWLYSAGIWRQDVASQPGVTSAQLRSLAASGQELTIQGVPVGAGTRMALDRDRDGYYDGDELSAGSDPGNPISTPGNVDVITTPLATGLEAARPNPFRGGTRFTFTLSQAASVELAVYDVVGREIRGIVPLQTWPAGAHTLLWDGQRSDGTSAGPGMYFIRLRANDQSHVRTVVKLAR